MMSILEQSAFHAVAEIPKAIRELAAEIDALRADLRALLPELYDQAHESPDEPSGLRTFNPTTEQPKDEK